jgi:hypothetical protein
LAQAHELGIAGDGVAGWCDGVSLRIADALRSDGLDAFLVLGKVHPPGGRSALHWWVELRGAYIDATADQFNRRFPGAPFPALTIAMPTELPSHVPTEVIRRYLGGEPRREDGDADMLAKNRALRLARISR